MGNSLRGYFGNLCGAEESKRAFTESSDEKQPQEQPKPEELPDGNKVDGKAKADTTDGAEDEDPPEILEQEEADKTQESLSQTPSGKRTLLYVLMNFNAPRFESFGIGQLDQKFESAQTTITNFVEFLHIFRNAILDFTKLFKKKEFEAAWPVYRENSEKEGEGKTTENDVKGRLTKDDIAKGTGLIKKGREQYPIIRKKITDTREKLNVVAKDVESLCIKDYVRDEMSDKSYMAKASVPGKYRRNAKAIRKKIKALDEAGIELEEWHRLTSVGTVDALKSKPDLLDDVKELKESPGIARRKQSTEEKPDNTKKGDESIRDEETGTNTVTEITLEDTKISEVEAQEDSLAHEVISLEDNVISDVATETPENVEGEGKRDDKALIVEDVCVSEVKVVEEATPFNDEKVEETETAKDLEQEADAIVADEHIKEENEKKAPTDTERETSPVPVEGKEKPTKKGKEEEKPKAREAKEKEKSRNVQNEGSKTPVAVPTVETKTVKLVVSVEPSTTGRSSPAAGSPRKANDSSAAGKVPCKRDAEDSPNTPDKSFRSEENDEVGVLPVVPGSSKLERKVSSTSADLEEGKLTDYGSYLVLTDDQDLLRRSRSLDSLTSRGSRQSMSRLGSFEMVTNFELTMAEQAESERRKALSSSQKSL